MSARTVLNVDDKPANRYVKSRSLRLAGFQVIEAANGREALDLAHERRPDVVLLDLKLPDISGFDVCRILKTDPSTRHIPVVHISSTFIGEETKSDSAQAGAEIYLAEPVAPQELTAALRTVLRLRAAERTLARTQVELETALEQARAGQRAAEEAARMKDEFLALLSHELRTPMAAVLGWLHLARSGRLSADKHERALAIVQRNAELQVQLVEDLLDVSRIIAGKLEFEEEPVALDEVLRHAVESASLSANERRVALQLQIGEGPIIVRGSARRLEQVFGNLLSNAIKFSPERAVVHIRAARENSHVVIAVRDEGEGIAPSMLPHVFETFRQADGITRRRHGGLGLGLAIVKSLVELHGGHVTAVSDGPGKGAKFLVSLPVAVDVKAAAGERGSLFTLAADVLRDIRILIVEDQTDHRELVELLLCTTGAAMRSVPDAASALRLVRQWRPDLLVLDIAMPSMDGYELLGQLREALGADADSLPAVAVTGFAAPSDVSRARESGFQEHLAKPFKPDQLIQVIARLAGRHRGGADE